MFMYSHIEIPNDLIGPFKRIMRRIPVELKKDENLIKIVLAYLQLGGERLARQAVASAKLTLQLEVAERRKKAREESLIRAAEARLAAMEDESDDEDDEDDFDDDADDDAEVDEMG